MATYGRKRGFLHHHVTPEHPLTNGLAENLVQNVAHTVYIEKQDQKETNFHYLMAYQATPHSATGKIPAELLYNWPIRTTIPEWGTSKVDKEVARRTKITNAR